MVSANLIDSWRQYKITAKHVLRYAKYSLRGDGRRFAHRQIERHEQYRHAWSQYGTPILRRQASIQEHHNRLHNMALAVAHLDGLLIQPGEIIGFWRQLPRPTTGNGYLPGPNLIHGQLKHDIGGGLCQVATTLFNALLLADFEILEHHNHSIDVHGDKRFFELGRDSSVAYGVKDLLARNHHRSTLLLRLGLVSNGTQLTAAVHSEDARAFDIRLQSEIVQELTPRDIGGGKGWVVATERLIRENDKHWQRNMHYVSHYAPHRAYSSQ